MYALFYKKFWSIVKLSVTLACLVFLNSGGYVDNINHTLNTLVQRLNNQFLFVNFIQLDCVRFYIR